MTIKLLKSAAIITLISAAVTQTAKGLAMLQDAADQCILHAEKHGDVTLAQRLMQEVKDNCKGVVGAGFRQWFEKYSPIAIIVDDKGNVKAKLLKEDEPGYKPFDTAKAIEAPALEAKEVTQRSNQKIEPFSIAMVKQRIKGMLSQVDKATAEGGRGVIGNPDTIKTFINGILVAADKIEVIEPKAGKQKVNVKAKKTVAKEAAAPAKLVKAA